MQQGTSTEQWNRAWCDITDSSKLQSVTIVVHARALCRHSDSDWWALLASGLDWTCWTEWPHHTPAVASTIDSQGWRHTTCLYTVHAPYFTFTIRSDVKIAGTSNSQVYSSLVLDPRVGYTLNQWCCPWSSLSKDKLNCSPWSWPRPKPSVLVNTTTLLHVDAQ